MVEKIFMSLVPLEKVSRYTGTNYNRTSILVGGWHLPQVVQGGGFLYIICFIVPVAVVNYKVADNIIIDIHN